MIAQITKSYIRHYRDNGQTTAYAEWQDAHGKNGRTEGDPESAHMVALFARAEREGITIEHQTW